MLRLKQIVGTNTVAVQFIKIISHYKNSYSMAVLT